MVKICVTWFLFHIIVDWQYLRQCISPAPCNLKETSISMLNWSKVALQKVVNQNCNSSELVLIIFTPDDSLLALGDHVQQLKETHSSMGLPRLPSCVMSPWKMCSRLTGRTLRRCTACHVLEHNFKYMDAVNAVLYTRYFIQWNVLGGGILVIWCSTRGPVDGWGVTNMGDIGRGWMV